MGFLSSLLLGSMLLFQAARTGVREEHRLLLQAQRYFENQRWEQSRQAALKALAIDPRLGDAEVLLGLVATVQSRFSEAERRFLKAAELEPGNPRVHAYLGATYLQLKRFGEAGRAFRKVLELEPGNPTASYNLGLIALIQNRPAAALPHFERAYRANSSDSPALIGMLESQLLLKRNREARESARKLETLLDPKDPRLFQAAALLATHGQYDASISIMEGVRKATPESDDLNYNLALAYFRTGQLDKAAAVLERSRRAAAYNLLGSIEEARKHPLESVRAFDKASQLEPANEDYRFDFANGLLQNGDLEAASSAFSSGIRDFPKSWRMRLGLGASYYLTGKYGGAAQNLLEAVKIEPEAKLTYSLLGQAYESAETLQGDIAEAFTKYLQKPRNDPWAYYHYGTILCLRTQAERKDDFSQAKANLRKALELNPSFAEAHLQLGIIAQSENRLEDSVRLFERAVQLDPKLAAAHYRLGLAYQRLGKRDEAKAELALFQQLKSESQAAEKGSVLDSLSRQRN